jgi:peptidoglycan/LPS O-acetylase OafA/YrhL
MFVSERAAYAVALGGGALLWIVTAKIAGRTEAWDAPMYWTITYPLAIVLAGLLGFLVPRRAWRWGLAVFLAQPVVLAVSASGFGLMPLGLILFAVLSLPAVGLAALAARFSPRRAPP